ncbi:uncharacterized protein MONBRDRAFT_31639 [Monosiga brevicollis MX1]|uniref:Palmitoyltransferase n=1 Tax=Monosiga brevicollis TaxID=81824 RepID=A9UUV3_MONBE|nr:uncharacterized protein MONBRDRAFT_31639 [Monosiga brevicollis MX1]EDQ90972.1 predicted protein [Monosiga brevicollis MX1]|eukprot:XP_001744269.1 hypothetical protein [Monosiga brevicollis MX1]
MDGEELTAEEAASLETFILDGTGAVLPCLPPHVTTPIGRSVARLARAGVAVLDNLMYLFGLILVFLAITLIGAIVYCYYKILMPYLYATSSNEAFVCHFLFAHWLLINIAFNYGMVVMTDPGKFKPTRVSDAEHEAYTRIYRPDYCFKCRSLRPARAHHCSICKRCVLNMDHHCPWINNCVGHFNHRYFFLFMAFLWVGCIYIMCVAGNLYLKRARARVLLVSDPSHPLVNEVRELHHLGYLGKGVTFATILTFAVAFALGILLFSHVLFVSRAETTIEFQQNFRQCWRDRSFRHPYSKGIWTNWKNFLGLSGRRTLLSVLFPSTHPPIGDGIRWTHLLPPQTPGRVV